MKFVVKVDRVKSVEEAVTLQRLGVNLIGISLGEKDDFDDDRVLSEDQASLIQKSLKSSKLVGDISKVSQELQISNIINDLNFDYIQINKSEILETINQDIDNQKKGIIYSPICLSYDEDPAWAFDGLNIGKYSYFQLDLLGDMENSWNFLVSKASEEPEELQIEDIKELSKRYPLLLTIDFSKNNISDILKSFPDICGITFVLGKSPQRNDIHSFNYLEVLEILEFLKEIKQVGLDTLNLRR
jgi:hypothetical protein